MQRLALWTILAVGIGAIWVLGIHRVVVLVWPDSLVEVVTVDPEGSRWRLVPADGGPEAADAVVTRPRNATVVETEGARLTGYVLGIRDGSAWIERPEMLRFARLDPVALEPGWSLVMGVTGNRQRSLRAGELVRIYRPNRLTLGQKLALAVEHLDERLVRRLGSLPRGLPEAAADRPAE